MKPVTCPNCKRFIANKVIRPTGRVDIYCSCGYSWNGYTDFENPDEEQMNEFYGNWTDEELSAIMNAIVKSNYCDDDRRFYKGRLLYTVWKERDGFDKVKAYVRLKSLVEKVVKA